MRSDGKQRLERWGSDTGVAHQMPLASRDLLMEVAERLPRKKQ